MLSRRYLWLLVAIPLAVLVLFVARRRSATPVPESTSSAFNVGPGIIYLSPASGEADLFYLDPDSNAPPPRLTIGADISSFDVAPDGAALVFSAPNTDDSLDLWQLDLFNGFVNVLYNCAAANCILPLFSPDGAWLAYQQLGPVQGVSSVWLLELSTGETNRASPDGQSSRDPAWSPDGRLSYYNEVVLAYEVVLPTGTTRLRFANETGSVIAWAPDSQSFVAAESYPASGDTLRGPRGESALATPDPFATQTPVEVLVSALIHYTDGRQTPLFDYSANLIEDASPAFSPDGALLAFTRKYLDEAQWAPGRQLWMLNLENHKLGILTNEPNYLVTAPNWSPDGSRLVYVRANQTDFSQAPEIWIITANGTNASGTSPRLLVLDAYAPHWVS